MGGGKGFATQVTQQHGRVNNKLDPPYIQAMPF